MTDDEKALCAYHTARARGARAYIWTAIHPDFDEQAHDIATALALVLGEPVADGVTPYRRLTWGSFGHPNATIYLPDKEETA